MADDNRFAGISEQLEDEEEGGSNSSGDSETAEESEMSEEGTQSTMSNASKNSGEGTDSTESEEGGPAFSFEASKQTSIYPRTETAEDTLDDVEFEVEGILRREYDVRDLAGRELHDAMIRLAAESPDDLAELIVDAREESE